MNRLISLIPVCLMAMSAAGCTHEARITGPTQCFAPAHARVMTEVAQAQTDLPEPPTLPQ